MFRHTLASLPGSRLARSLLLGAALSAALAAPALANPFETTLANGMKLIVKEDRRAPSVVHMVWYRAGAMDEPDGVSGVAHVLEHMPRADAVGLVREYLPYLRRPGRLLGMLRMRDPITIRMDLTVGG